MIRLSLRCLAIYVAFVARAFAASASLEITVEAGAHERKNVPVRTPMPHNQIGGDPIASVTLAGPDGKSIPAQWTGPSLASNSTGELHFILPHLARGESMRLKATLSTQPAITGEGFTWRNHPGQHMELTFGDRPILRYHYERLDESTPASRVRTYKVFHHVFSLNGKRIITNGLLDDPKVHSPHHRGIFYGFNRIIYGQGKTADTWHCLDGAFQQHEAFLKAEEGPVLGRHRTEVSWHGKDAAFAAEARELTVFVNPVKVTVHEPK